MQKEVQMVNSRPDDKAVILYMPVIHNGYMEFLFRYKDTHQIYLIEEHFDEKLLAFKKYVSRDVRKIDTKLVCKTLKSLYFDVYILTTSLFETISKSYREIVMPDEDVSKEIMEVYPHLTNVTLVSTVLRYDKLILEKKFNVDPNAILTGDEFAKKILEKAFKIAKTSPDWWRQVGCVIITKDGHEITSCNNHTPSKNVASEMGDPRSNFDSGIHTDLSLAIHAETSAIAQAAKIGTSLEGGMLYCTTFPCPGCARIIAASGIKEVYFKEGYSLIHGKDIFDSVGIKVFQVV